jgi:hypothetical protein
VFGENVAKKGDVQNIRTQCGSVKKKGGMAGGSNNIIIFVIMGEKGLTCRVTQPRSPGYVLCIKVASQYDPLAHIEKEVQISIYDFAWRVVNCD